MNNPIKKMLIFLVMISVFPIPMVLAGVGIITPKQFADASNTLASEGIAVGDWAQYSEADLLMYTGNGVGNQSWCQAPAGAGAAVTRGKNGVSYILSVSTTSVGTNLSWRPCLELVS